MKDELLWLRAENRRLHDILGSLPHKITGRVDGLLRKVPILHRGLEKGMGSLYYGLKTARGALQRNQSGQDTLNT